MTSLNRYDLLLGAVEKCDEYPGNLIGTRLPRDVIQSHQEYLNNREEKLFNSKAESVVLWEAWAGDFGKT